MFVFGVHISNYHGIELEMVLYFLLINRNEEYYYTKTTKTTKTVMVACTEE